MWILWYPEFGGRDLRNHAWIQLLENVGGKAVGISHTRGISRPMMCLRLSACLSGGEFLWFTLGATRLQCSVLGNWMKLTKLSKFAWWKRVYSQYVYICIDSFFTFKESPWNGHLSHYNCQVLQGMSLEGTWLQRPGRREDGLGVSFLGLMGWFVGFCESNFPCFDPWVDFFFEEPWIEEGNSTGKVIGKVQLFSGLARSMANCRIVLFLLLNTFGNIPTMWDVLQILLWILYVCDIM